MIERNQHKFHEKNTICLKDLLPYDDYNQNLSLNYSRTIGNSKNWIGCGYLNKAGVKVDHVDTQFPFYSLVYIIEGEGSYIDESGKRYALSRGMIFQRKPWVKHTTLIKPDSGWREYYLDCNEDLYQQLCAMLLINNGCSVFQATQSKSIAVKIEALIEHLKHRAEDEIFDVYLSYLDILRTMFTERVERTIPSEMIKKCLDDFDLCYATRFDLKEYCESNGWGYEKFRKTFKSHLGVSPQNYLIRKRMDEACRLLRASNLRISEISYKLGYKSQYEFSNQFHRYFDIAPKYYRNGVS